MRHNISGIEFVRIPSGRFAMGSTGCSPLERRNEMPLHEVVVNSFLMSVCPITQSDFSRVMLRNPSYFSPTGDGNESVAGMDVGCFPVDSVSWEDAAEFCRRLSARPDEWGHRHSFRLPTEAEWEYACKGGADTIFANGDSLTSLDANINGLYPINSEIIGPTLNRPCQVGRYAPNGFGLYDMHGNVWEWCLDVYMPYGSSLVPNEDARVLRGGAWDCYSRFCRSAYRCLSYKDAHFYDCGFRIVCEINETPIE
mgnify:CR=1 FL=1